MAGAPENPRGIRVDDATWKRFRTAAFNADKSQGEMLAALLDTYEQTDRAD